MIDTNAAPGTSPNLDYWEVGFQFACMRAITGGTSRYFGKTQLKCNTMVTRRSSDK